MMANFLTTVDIELNDTSNLSSGFGDHESNIEKKQNFLYGFCPIIRRFSGFP